MSDDINALIRNITVDNQDGRNQRFGEGMTYDSELQIWSTSIGVVDADGVETVYELEIEFVPPNEGEDLPGFVVVRWLVVVPDEMRISAADNLDLHKTINELNAWPGCKFRLMNDDRNDYVVCEVDLPADLVTAAGLQFAFEYSRDAVALHLETLKDVCC
jgi:hypothetical protein